MNRKLKNEELGRLSAGEFKRAAKTPVVIVLDDIRSAYNVGSVFRTADAFLIEAIFLCGFTPFPPHREIQKTALGANETVSWKYFKHTGEAISELKGSGYTIAVIEQTEKSISLDKAVIKKGEKLALVFGNEVGGVSQSVADNADVCIEIPQYGTKHSLNISVCAGIVLWEIFRKLHK
jgi:23S rRNA (guanosine2251-2'-O)-methyltransferase